MTAVFSQDILSKSLFKWQELAGKELLIKVGHVSEFELKCSRCRVRVAYWGYGYYDPCFAVEEL